MVWGVRYRSAGLSNGVHNVLTPYNISSFPQLSAHTFTRLKTAGCMQEGWWSRTSGVALHILIGNFSCLLMAGQKTVQNMVLHGHKALFYYPCIEIEPLVLVALNVEVVEAHQRASCRKGCWVGNDLAVIELKGQDGVLEDVQSQERNLVFDEETREEYDWRVVIEQLDEEER